MARGELANRILVAVVGIPVAFAVAYRGGWVLGGALALIALLSAREFYALAGARGGRPIGLLGLSASVALVLLATAFPSYDALAPWAFGVLIALLLLVLGFAVWGRGAGGSPTRAVSSTVVGSLYTGGTLSFALLLRHLPDAKSTAAGSPWNGALLLLFPMVVTWCGDSCALFAGRRWGRAKLIPSVSPGKTVVGGVAGLFGSVTAAAVMAAFFLDSLPLFAISLPVGVVMGVAIGGVAQIGDLAESVLKREARVKDSGGLIPGHGGFLDRFDALFFTIPLAYVLILLGEALK